MTLQEVQDLAEKLTQLTGRDRSSSVTQWLLAIPRERDELQSALELEHRQLAAPDALWLPPIPADRLAGDLKVGVVLAHDKQLHPFRHDVEDLLRHVTIFGQSGSGKTNLAYIYLLDLLKRGTPFLVFDWKRNYRDLLAMPGSDEVEVYTVGRNVRPFQLNPLADRSRSLKQRDAVAAGDSSRARRIAIRAGTRTSATGRPRCALAAPHTGGPTGGRPEGGRSPCPRQGATPVST